MTLNRIAYLSTILSPLTFSEGAMAGADGAANTATQPNFNLPVMELKWGSAGVSGSNGVGTLQAAQAYGDSSKGAHATLIKMPAGFVSTVHIHTHDYYEVVINGVTANASSGEKSDPLPPGSYWFQTGASRT